MRLGSVLAFLLMVAGLGVLIIRQEIFGVSLASRAVQVLAASLMIAARIAFGLRSFRAAANPTEGGVVTSGPYRYIRHPIYAAILYFAPPRSIITTVRHSQRQR